MKLKNYIVFLPLAVSSLMGQTPAAAPAAGANAITTPAPVQLDPNKVVLSFGDKTFTAKQVEDLLLGLPEQLRAGAEGPGKRQFIEQFADFLMFANEAKRTGLTETAEAKRTLEFQQMNIAARLMQTELLKKVTPSDAELRALYDADKEKYLTLTGRHILIRTPGSTVPVREGKTELTEKEALLKAQEIREKIEKGGNFDEIAKAESDDRGSGERGGDLGQFARGMMIPEFEKVAFALLPGIVSQPVKTSFGYHIIRIDAKNYREFDAVKEEIKNKILSERMQGAIKSLKEQVKLTIDPAYLDSLVAKPTPAPLVEPGPAVMAPKPAATKPATAKPAPKPAVKPATTPKP